MTGWRATLAVLFDLLLAYLLGGFYLAFWVLVLGSIVAAFMLGVMIIITGISKWYEERQPLAI